MPAPRKTSSAETAARFVAAREQTEAERRAALRARSRLGWETRRARAEAQQTEGEG